MSNVTFVHLQYYFCPSCLEKYFLNKIYSLTLIYSKCSSITAHINKFSCFTISGSRVISEPTHALA